MVSKIRELIASGETENALNALVDFFIDKNESFYNDSILLLGDYRKQNRAHYLGLSNNRNDLLRIDYAVLEIISTYEKNRQNNIDKSTFRLVDATLDVGASNYKLGNGIIEIDQNNYHSNKHNFPVIDFRFQNTSSSKRYLYKFGISIDEIQIDKTPKLVFDNKIEGFEKSIPGRLYRDIVTTGALSISVKNVGWGTAENLRVRIKEKNVEKYYEGKDLIFNGSIESGKTENIISLSFIDNLLEIEDGFELENIDIFTEYTDEYGNNIVIKTTTNVKKNYSKVSLTNKGFEKIYEDDGILFSFGGSSETMHIVMINPDDTTTTKIYPISYIIEPLGIERFQILIGATKSCFLKLRFTFEYDTGEIVESSPFLLKILNPIGSELNWHYGNGDLYLLKHTHEKKGKYPFEPIIKRVDW
jgi:hypothetical protein